MFSAVFAEGTEDSPIGDYTVTYSSEGDTFIIRNTRSIDTVDITAYKLWSDAENQDGIRPREIKLQLKADGINKGTPVVVSEDDSGNWSYTWEKLPVNRDQGIPIVYTVVEAEEITGYSSSVSEDGLTVTNHHDPEMMELKVEWEWVDENNRDGVRPDTAEVSVYLGEENYGDLEFNKDDTSTKTITVPKYTPGEKGVPAVYEAKIKTLDDKYTGKKGTPSAGADLKMEGHYDPVKISVTASKQWEDYNNQDGKRPSTVTYALVTDNVEGDPVSVNVSDSPDFSYVWENLYKYRDQGVEINYSVVEKNSGAYTPSYSCEKSSEGVACVVTNTHEPSNIDLELTWIWNDDNDRDGKRQDTVTVEVFIGDLSVGTMTFDGVSEQETQILSVPEYVPGSEGERAEYTYVIHNLIDEYSDALNNSNPLKPVIIASYDPEKISVRASKSWLDENNRDGKRPDSLTYALVTDGVQGDPVVVTKEESPDFSKIWTDLYRYHDKGKEYIYSVAELNAGDYTPSYSCQERSYGIECVITNSLDIETKDLPIRWTWDDDNDRDGERQDNVVVEVYLGDELIGTVEFSGDDETSVKTITVPVYTPGEEGVPAEFTYVVKDLHSEYEDTLDNTDKNAPEIIASYEPKKTSVKASKQWSDNNNQDGKRPSSVTYALTIDGVNQEPVTVTSSESAQFEKVWTNLYRYHDGGIEYVYGVVELSQNDYVPSYNCNKSSDGSTVCIVTNTREVDTKELNITWIWDDDSDRDGKRQDTVHVDVYLDGEIIGTVTFPGGSETKTETLIVPENVPGKEGVPAEFTYVVRDLHSEYEDTLNDTDKLSPVIIASYDPELMSVNVGKTWDDDNNRDGARPVTVTWQLTKDGKPEGDPVTMPAENSSYTWNNLYVYHDHGIKYDYSVSELNVPDSYNATSERSDSGDSVNYQFTNSHDTEKLNVTPKIVWEDDDDRDGIRPETLVIRIIADDAATEYTFQTDEEEGWKHLFEELPKYNNGVEIDYAFEIIDKVNDYTYRYDPEDEWTIIYTHKPERVSFAAVVKWIDDDNMDGLRPGNVSVQLYANGEPVGDPHNVMSALANMSTGSTKMFRSSFRGDIYEITDKDDWKTEWTDLPRYIDKEEVVYTARQLDDLMPDYSTETEDFENCSVITNIHLRDKVDAPFIIIWDDLSNQDGLRPSEIELVIKDEDDFEDSKKVGTTEDELEDKFEDLVQNIDGKPVKYKIDLERVPDHYTAKIEVRPDGTTVITLKYEPGDLVTKSILDENGKKWSDEICFKWDVVTVRLVAFNSGRNTLYNVTVRDRLPKDATFILDSENMTEFNEAAGDKLQLIQGWFIQANIAELKPGEKRIITYKAKAYDPTSFGHLPAYFDFGNDKPLEMTAPNPARETNTVDPCRLTEPAAEPSGPKELPKTGFAPNVVTKLPNKSVHYQAYNQLRIRIPKLGVDAEILGVPYADGNWDVTWLGGNVGWLQNTAYPATTGAGNSVLTGHLTNHYGQPGVFSGLERLGYGDQIIIEAFGETFTYIVDETMTVYHDTPQVLSQNVDLPVLTLITCKFYNSQTNSYDGRIVVKAKLASIS